MVFYQAYLTVKSLRKVLDRSVESDFALPSFNRLYHTDTTQVYFQFYLKLIKLAIKTS